MIEALTNPALAPLFRRPARVGVVSAWYGHVPFAYWIVAAARPRSLVELGAHNGASYAAFCESVMHEQLDTRCYAIDTWQGDDHAGFYGEEVYADLQRFHDARYAGFSELIRGTFDSALPYIPDNSIDLLHIDGRHGYDDVRHDYESWIPKLSDRAIVLFHDTNVRWRDFGVWRLFGELAERRPTFEFLHAFGLGVLAHGDAVPEAVLTLCSLQNPEDVATVRERFTLLGERWMAHWDLTDREQALARVSADLEQSQHWGKNAQDEVNRLWPLYRDLLGANRTARANLAVTRHDLAAQSQTAERLVAVLADLEDRRAALEAAHADALAHAAAARADTEASRQALDTVLASRAWRITAPVRRAGSLLRGRLTSAPDAAAATPAPKAADPAPPPRCNAPILFVSGESHTPGHIYRVVRMAAVAQRLGLAADCAEAAPVGPAELAGRRLVVLWRVPWSSHIQGIIDVAHENGATVVFDVDDLMFRPELAVTEIIDGIRSQRFSELETQAFFGSIQRAMLDSDFVTCTTEELAFHVRRLGRPAMVVPNGFDEAAVARSRLARRNWYDCADGLLRIGYAGGSRTHQKDFFECAAAVAAVLRARPEARLVLFRDPSSGEGLVLTHEFASLTGLEAQIEWRDMVPLGALPDELARFDINLAPLENANVFCAAKSELKYFEAALAGVPTVASPTGPFRRAIQQDRTGLLAATPEEWEQALTALAADPGRRARLGRDAYHDALAQWGPEARARAFRSVLEQAAGGAAAAHGFALYLRQAAAPRRDPPHVPEGEQLFRADKLAEAAVTVIIPVYNYADYILEALESVRAQTALLLDLVVIDDRSSDDSVQMVTGWLEQHAGRFNRVLLHRHTSNAGLGFARNSGFALAETPFVLPLDADNRLRAACCAQLLAALEGSEAAYAYPAIQQFGDKNKVFGGEPYSPLRLMRGNVIDAMALVRKQAWAAAGGYDHVRYGWEDYDFWCRLAEIGEFGLGVPEVLADYRVHARSMLHTLTEVRGHKLDLIADLERRHPWLDIPTEVD